MFKRLFAITLTFGMAATAPPAFAKSCAQREHVIAKLQDRAPAPRARIARTGTIGKGKQLRHGPAPE